MLISTISGLFTPPSFPKNLASSGRGGSELNDDLSCLSVKQSNPVCSGRQAGLSRSDCHRRESEVALDLGRLEFFVVPGSASRYGTPPEESVLFLSPRPPNVFCGFQTSLGLPRIS